MQAYNSTNFSTTATLAGAAAAASCIRKSRNEKLYGTANSQTGAKEIIEAAFKTASRQQHKRVDKQ
jgi:hypothetical protein